MRDPCWHMHCTRFVGVMTLDEKDLAIQRIQLGVDTRLSMPPRLFRSLDDRERQLMIDELRR